jgi:hypothetical protein
MAGEVITYSWHTVSKRFRNVMALLLAIACIGLASRAHTGALAAVAALFGLGAVAAQINQNTTIDMSSLKVERKITLWGRCLRNSQWSLSDFTGIGDYRVAGGADSNDLVQVGLRRRSGSILSLRYFNVVPGQPCPAAESFVHDLEGSTGLSRTRVE